MLGFVVLYKFCDAFAGTMTAPFVIDLGFSRNDYATIVKGVGLAATLIGGFAGGALAARYDLVTCLWIGAIVQMVSNLVFTWLALVGTNHWALTAAIIAENFTGAIGTVIFVAYLSALCKSPLHTATQFALLTALAAVGRTYLSAGAGYVAECDRLADVLRAQRAGRRAEPRRCSPGCSSAGIFPSLDRRASCAPTIDEATSSAGTPGSGRRGRIPVVVAVRLVPVAGHLEFLAGPGPFAGGAADRRCRCTAHEAGDRLGPGIVVGHREPSAGSNFLSIHCSKRQELRPAAGLGRDQKEMLVLLIGAEPAQHHAKRIAAAELLIVDVVQRVFDRLIAFRPLPDALEQRPGRSAEARRRNGGAPLQRSPSAPASSGRSSHAPQIGVRCRIAADSVPSSR